RFRQWRLSHSGPSAFATPCGARRTTEKQSLLLSSGQSKLTSDIASTGFPLVRLPVAAQRAIYEGFPEKTLICQIDNSPPGPTSILSKFLVLKRFLPLLHLCASSRHDALSQIANCV